MAPASRPIRRDPGTRDATGQGAESPRARESGGNDRAGGRRGRGGQGAGGRSRPARQGTAGRDKSAGQGAGGQGAGGQGAGGQGSASARAFVEPARLAAYEVLRAVAERDAYANLMLPSVLAQRGLSGRDAALATELTYGTLRGQGTYDAVLAACSARDLHQIDPPVLDVLRLGAHQLLATRVRPHAAVATSVDLVRAAGQGGAAGFVNAVLRKVASRDLAAWVDATAPDRAKDPIGHLAVRHSHPRWIVASFAESLGEDAAGGLPETADALAANAVRPLVSLCVVPGLADQDELIEQGARPAQWSPFGGYLAGGDPAGLELVRRGRAAVQDEASQLAALALVRADAGESDTRWLDLCAGPGGKARLLTGLAATRGVRLLASDVRPHRAGLVRAATAGITAMPGVTATAESGHGESGHGESGHGETGHGETGHGETAGHGGPARVTAVAVADGTRPAWRPGSFDRVIADVPCSGLGALRRRPEARWRKTPADVAALAALQRRLLASAIEAVRPGGVVAYVTCSPHVAETRAVALGALVQRSDVTLLDAPALLPEVPGLRCQAGDGKFAQFWPHRHGTDAIFLALFLRHPQP